MLLHFCFRSKLLNLHFYFEQQCKLSKYMISSFCKIDTYTYVIHNDLVVLLICTLALKILCALYCIVGVGSDQPFLFTKFTFIKKMLSKYLFVDGNQNGLLSQKFDYFTLTRLVHCQFKFLSKLWLKKENVVGKGDDHHLFSRTSNCWDSSILRLGTPFLGFGSHLLQETMQGSQIVSNCVQILKKILPQLAWNKKS